MVPHAYESSPGSSPLRAYGTCPYVPQAPRSVVVAVPKVLRTSGKQVARRGQPSLETRQLQDPLEDSSFRPTIVTVILNWKRASDTIACAESVLRSDYSRNVVIIVDNGSEDGSEEILRSRFPYVHIVQTGQNLGFAGGMNRGIEAAMAFKPFGIWILNNDTIVDQDCLSKMVESLKGTRVGAVGGKIYDPDSRHANATYGGGVIHWRSIRTRHVTKPSVAIDYVTGASMLLRADALEGVGKFDESFFMYWEDVDLSLRLQKAGWQLAQSEGTVWHRESTSVGRQSLTQDLFYTQSTVRFCRKWYSHPMIYLGPLIFGRVAKRLLRGRPEHALVVMRAAIREWRK